MPRMPVLFPVLSLAWVTSASAYQLEVDLFQRDDALLTRDTATGLDWLDLPLTANRSALDVATGAGGWTTVHGFRYATQGEVRALWEEAGIDLALSGDPAVIPAVEVVFSLLGETISDYNEGTYWYPQMCCGYRTALLDARNPSLPRVELTPNASVGDFFSAPELANFLVRPAPPDEYEVYDAGTGLTGTLLGGSSAPGGLDVSFQSTAGGVLLAEYDPLTSQELSERIVDGDLQVLDFAVPGDTIQLWEIEYTLGLPGPAPFTNATVTFSYDEALLGPFPEGALAVYHFQSGSWHRLASTVDTANNRITVTVSSFSPFVLGLDPACDDGLDGDGDGAADFPGDPGCTDPEDASERDPGLACDDGLDQDGDTLVDYPADPGCRDTSWTRENPQCDDGTDNDGDGGIDWDGFSAQGTPDPQCVDAPWRGKERSGGCGLGGEAMIPGILIGVLARRLGSRSARTIGVRTVPVRGHP